MNVGSEFLNGLHEPEEYLRVVTKSLVDPVWWAENVVDVTLFPAQAEIMREFYRNNYKRLILVAGMRSGKSTLAALMATYEFWRLYVLPDPAKRYGLFRKQPIFISVIATSEKQAEDAVFANIRTLIEDCSWFGEDVKVKDAIVECRAKNIYIRLLSSWSTTAVGRSNKAVVFDELALFEETSGKRGAWEVFSRLSKSTDTFGRDGKIIAISSPKHPNDIIMTLYRQLKEDRETLALMKPTWEMNPNYTKEALMEEHKYDLAAFWRDYACQPQVTNALQFPEGVETVPMVNVLDERVEDQLSLIHI